MRTPHGGHGLTTNCREPNAPHELVCRHRGRGTGQSGSNHKQPAKRGTKVPKQPRAEKLLLQQSQKILDVGIMSILPDADKFPEVKKKASPVTNFQISCSGTGISGLENRSSSGSQIVSGCRPALLSSLSNVKLPTITLPEFDGDYSKWLTFHDTFLSLIHSSSEISCVQKFHYLRSSLFGEAAGKVANLEISAQGYAIAWETLTKYYNDKNLLRKKHIRTLLKYPKIPNDSVEALHRIVDDFQCHTQTLKQLGEPIEQMSSILIELLEDKLDDASLSAWEESIGQKEERSTFSAMIEFLQRRARVRETIQINRPQQVAPKSGSHNPAPKKPFQTRVNSNAAVEIPPKTFPLCPACDKQKHSIMDCAAFNGMNVSERMRVITDKRLCSNCFRSDHFARNCRSKYHCKHCNKRHHSMIHPGPGSQDTNPIVATPAMNPAPVNAATKSRNASVLLSTVVLAVLDSYGKEHLARALLDTGSQPNVMSEHLCQQLHLFRKVANVPISGVDSAITNAKHKVSTEVRSRVSRFAETLDFLVLRKVTCETPPVTIPIAQWKIPEHLALADPEFNVSRKVDMIIGAAHFYSFLLEGRIRLAGPVPLLVESVFGWIATGSVEVGDEAEQQPTVACHVVTVESVDKMLERFWALEEVGSSNYSVDEHKCEAYFKETVARDESGRYVVKLPKHPEFQQMIGASKTNAVRRFRWLEQKLENQPELKPQYHEFMQEYLTLGHMHAVPDDAEDESSRACYLPHHPVIKEQSSTTKVRVVFDGSAKTSAGHSLNDALLVGPVSGRRVLCELPGVPGVFPPEKDPQRWKTTPYRPVSCPKSPHPQCPPSAGLHELVKLIHEDTQDGSLYRTSLAVHHGEYELAQTTLDLLDMELTATAGGVCPGQLLVEDRR
ncbi:uncharacterized protein LOC120429231 [Culex pipiens pallens]|uniref:uncharacterized protein LOC120429231 n=1 Tax=Culex pipiens pallens TaxID=42434 RepID=UPI001954DF25|nr:uncharacterized protein LOC120429231 [Culex pipiens pallens]